jgi:hypothetical protein
MVFICALHSFTVSVKLWSWWLQCHDSKDFTFSQFHSFTEPYGGVGVEQGSGVRVQGSKRRGTKEHRSGLGLDSIMERVCAERGKLSADFANLFAECFQRVAGRKYGLGA